MLITSFNKESIDSIYLLSVLFQELLKIQSIGMQSGKIKNSHVTFVLKYLQIRSLFKTIETSTREELSALFAEKCFQPHQTWVYI